MLPVTVNYVSECRPNPFVIHFNITCHDIVE